MEESDALKVIKEKYEDGMVIVGCSAGALSQTSTVMITGNYTYHTFFSVYALNNTSIVI